MVKRKTTEEFIKGALEVHGDRYDYSEVVYKTALEKVKIICPDHGVFLQRPNAHLQGHRCPVCHPSGTRSSTKDFIKKARAVHGDSYDYSCTDYRSANEKVKIICAKHGEFEQTPANHIHRRNRCPKCGSEDHARVISHTTDVFVQKARAIHGDYYNYSSVDYSRWDIPVSIACPLHGEFKQRPSVHLDGSGCPLCANSLPGSLVYLIEVETGSEHFGKVGITTHSVNRRFPSLVKYMTTHVLHDFIDTETARLVEKDVLKTLEYTGMMVPAECLQGNGSTETFSVSALPQARELLETHIRRAVKHVH